MVLKGRGRFNNRRTPSTGGKLYDWFYIYVPAELARDSGFPFKAGTDVGLEVRGGVLIVRRCKEEQ